MARDSVGCQSVMHPHLNLRKGFDDMPIVCSLRVAFLDDDPYYESLSYVWGDLKDTRPVNC